LKGLLIRKRWIDAILAGDKTWELRGTSTRQRGEIALIQSKSGTVVGVAELVDVKGPFTREELQQRTEHCVPPSEVGQRYERTYAWVLDNARRLDRPVPYQHPSGAVIWVRLDESVIAEIRNQLR
jgi:hypothetical protein